MFTDLSTDTNRLKAVNRFLNLKISREKELEDVLNLAASICQAPVALITLMDKDVQYFKFKTGTELDCNLRQHSFCNYLNKEDKSLVVSNLKLDERFTHNPLVNTDKPVLFYAGIPLVTRDGEFIGSLCVLDYTEKVITQTQIDSITILARQVINILELELSLSILKNQYEEAQNASNKLRSFFESSVSCHALLDRNFAVVTFNKALYNFVYRMFGVEIVQGIRATDYVDRMYINDFVGNFNQALQGENIVSERLINHPLLGNIWYQFTYNPAYDSEGNIMGISWNAADITESKTHEQRILQQNEALRKIAYVQSHEFRKPVASILGLLNVMKTVDRAEQEDCLDMIEQSANELDSTIKHIIHTTEPVLLNINDSDFDAYLTIAL
jgi:PAS domain S-box-containing protein